MDISKNTLPRLIHAILCGLLITLCAVSHDARAADSLTIAYGSEVAPFQFTNEQGEAAGMLIDVWKLWAEKTGVKVEFVPAPWRESLAMVREGKTDTHAGMFYTTDRDAYLDYGPSLAKTDTHIFYHESLPDLSGGEELLAYRVGVIQGDTVGKYLRDNHPGISLADYASLDEMMADMRSGRIKVVALDTPTGVHYLQKNNLADQFQYVAGNPLYRSEWFAAVPEGREDTLTLIKSGMDRISPEEKVAVIRQWTAHGKRRDTDTLIIAMDRNYPPASVMSRNGEPQGMLVDFWKLWAEKTGSKIDFRPSDWAGTLDAVKSGEADVHIGLFKTPERSTWLEFGKPVFHAQSALYFRVGDIPRGLDQMRGKRIGVVDGWFQEEFIMNNHPEVTPVVVEGLDALVFGLLKGTMDAILCETLTMDAELKALDMQGALVRHQDVVFSKSIHPAVLKKRRNLLDRIDDGFEEVDREDFAEVEKRWVSDPMNRVYRSGSGKSGIALTPQEHAWIREHPTITVAVMNAWPPLDFVDKSGVPQGVGVDYLQFLGKRLGIEFTITAGPFKDNLAAVRDKRIDALMDVTPKPDRDAYCNFTQPYLTIPHIIVARSDGPYFETENDLDGMTVAIEEGFYNAKHFRDNHPGVTVVEYSDTAACLGAVSMGKADAYAGNRAVATHIMSRDMLPNLQVQGKLSRKGSVLAIGVRKDWPELAQLLDKALNSLTFLDEKAILSKWSSDAKKDDRVSLTQEELDWIRKNPAIRVAATPDWPPFEFESNAQYQGVAADILRLAAQRVGIQLDIRLGPWPEHVKELKSGGLDLSPAMVRTTEREEYLLFTDSVFTSNVAIFVEEATTDIRSMADLQGKTVAIEKGYATQELIAEQYPGIDLLLVDSALDAIRLVSIGQADAYVGNQAAGTYLMNRNLLNNIKVTGYYDEASRDLLMGVRKDAPLLVSILNKGLATITIRERNDLLARYVFLEAASRAKKTLSLTAEEKEWIAEHKNIRLGVDPAWAPLESIQGVTYSGLSAEYVRQLARNTGLTFTQPPISDWSRVVTMARDGVVDLLPAIARTPDRAKDLAFSKPYIRLPLLIYQQTSSLPVKNMGDLDGKSVAVIAGHYTEAILRDSHPQIVLQTYSTLENALKAVSRNAVDALIDCGPTVENAKQKLSLFNVAPSIKTPYNVELRFGVRKEWGVLVGIIDKWLDTLNKDKKEALLNAAGVEVDVSMADTGVEERVDYTQLLMLGVGVIVVFGVSLVLLVFLRRLVRNRAETLYSSHQYKVVGIVVGILFLCLVMVATWLALTRVEGHVRRDVGNMLESVLLTTHESLAIWQQQKKASIRELTEDPHLRGLTEALLSLPERRDLVKASPQLFNIRRFMNKAKGTRGFVEFAIVSKNYLNYATSDNEDLLDKNAISILRPRVLDKAFLGFDIFVPPVTIHHEHEGDHGAGDIMLVSFAAPIRNNNGKILAVLLLSYDVAADYQRILSMGRVGMTGETYAIDKNGGLVSASRFDDQLQELGLVNPDQQAILSLRIADPGGNLAEGHALDTDVVLPLTLSARSATARKSGVNINGYRDYRGVSVFGAWMWDSELGLGLITEMDENKALGSFRLVRNTVVAVIFITILLGSLMTGLSNWIGQSAARSLRKAKEELEDKVEERTADLKKITVAVEQSPATVVITDTQGTIQYVNPTFTAMTGYTWEEAIGQNPRVLRSGHHSPEFYAELWETILNGEVWQGDFLNRKKTGELFWERAAIAPVYNDEHELTNFVAVKEDITERKAEEERFQALLDAAPDAMVIVAQNGDIALVNIATEELFGYEREAMIGQKVEMLVPESIREAHPGHRDSFFASPGDMSLVAGKEFSGQTKSGDLVPVDISLSPIETADGLQLIASVRDITDRKRAEEAIKEQERRLRVIIDNLPSVIILKDSKGRHQLVNKSYELAVGFTSDMVLGKTDAEFMPPDAADHIMRMDRDILEAGQPSTFEERVPHPDGSDHAYLTTKVPLIDEDGTASGLVILATDITDRMKAEARLAESEERTRLILSSAGEGIFGVNLQGEAIFINDAACTMLQYELEEIMGKPIHDLIHHTRADGSFYPVKECPMAHAFTKGTSSRIDDEVLWRKDGTGFEVEYSAFPVKRDDEIMGAVISFQDITQRKAAERERDDAYNVITSSIQYASRIQRSVLPPETRLEDLTVDHFVVWEPRDVVGGDMYWCELWGEGAVIILGDCTGHGVPGAFMTLLAAGALKRALSSVREGDAAGLVSAMHKSIQKQLGQHVENDGAFASDDGLELGVCYLAPDNNTVTFSGARLPLIIDRGDTIEVLKGDKKGIAYRGIPHDFEYTNKVVELDDNMALYMTTDGILDQIGGEKRRGFGKKRLLRLIESLRGTSFQNHGEAIYAELMEYQGKEKRRDDVSIVGFRL